MILKEVEVVDGRGSTTGYGFDIQLFTKSTIPSLYTVVIYYYVVNWLSAIYYLLFLLEPELLLGVDDGYFPRQQLYHMSSFRIGNSSPYP